MKSSAHSSAYRLSIPSVLMLLLLSVSAWLSLACMDETTATDPFSAPQGRICLVTFDQSAALSPAPLAPALLQQTPGVAAAVRLMQHGFGTPAFVQSPALAAREPQLYFADRALFHLFPFRFMNGDPQTALAQPDAVVLTHTLAQKYFPHGDAMGQTLRLDNRFTLTVTGVIADLPANAAFHPELLVSFTTNRWAAHANSWKEHRYPTFLQLTPDADAGQVASDLQQILSKKPIAESQLIHLEPVNAQHPELVSRSFSAAPLRANRVFSWLFNLITPAQWG